MNFFLTIFILRLNFGEVYRFLSEKYIKHKLKLMLA